MFPDRLLSRILRLTLLAPDLLEAILDGSQPATVTLAALMEPFPAGWEKQRAAVARAQVTQIR